MGKGLEWQHVMVVKESSVSGQARVKCKYCGHSWTGGADRIRAHIIGKRGVGVEKCQRAPSHVFNEYEKKEEAKLVKKAKEHDPQFNPDDARICIQELRQESLASAGVASIESAGGLSLSSVYDNNVSRKRRQEDSVEGGSGIQKMFRHTYRNRADETQRRLFYGCGIAYNIAQSKLFKDHIAAVAKAGPGYKPLSFNDLRGRHLQEEYNSVEKRLQPVKNTWKRYGVSICSDGWSDVRKRPIVNFVATNCFGSMFLKSVDASGKKKDAAVIEPAVLADLNEEECENVTDDAAYVEEEDAPESPYESPYESPDHNVDSLASADYENQVEDDGSFYDSSPAVPRRTRSIREIM